MDRMIYNPLEAYTQKLKALHLEKTEQFFEMLTKQSGVNITENRATVAEYDSHTLKLKKQKRKLDWLRVLRVLAIITLVLLPLVFLKLTPKIRALREEIATAEEKAAELLARATAQMEPLCRLCKQEDALRLVEATVPLLTFEPLFSLTKETDMKLNYDYRPDAQVRESTLDALSGTYNGNPFVFENKRIQWMGTETYHGYKNISWSETYRDSKGQLRRRTRHQTLHATVTKPKPFYKNQVVLSYGAQGGPELCFSRDATHLEKKSRWELERHIDKGERKLKKKANAAVAKNKDFSSMSNTDFEVLFDALDRNDEVQFRTLFTPLAQTNMTDLILSKDGYGDDFHFIKRNRMNQIITNHSQDRHLLLSPQAYCTYSYDSMQEKYRQAHSEYFKAVYFDFAPLLAIPIYQERPVHSLKPIPKLAHLYSQKEGEVLANTAGDSCFTHPDTKTQAILKTETVDSADAADVACVTAYSFDTASRVEMVPVFGGDGRMHSVAVNWEEYLPLEQKNYVSVSEDTEGNKGHVLARKNGLCMLKKQ